MIACPFIVATYVSGEHALPILRPASTLGDAMTLAYDLAALGMVRVFVLDGDRLVLAATMRGRLVTVVRGHECVLCGAVTRESP
jgi:hypothetical protein